MGERGRAVAGQWQGEMLCAWAQRAKARSTRLWVCVSALEMKIESRRVMRAGSEIAGGAAQGWALAQSEVDGMFGLSWCDGGWQRYRRRKEA